MSIDKQRIAAVAKLEELGFPFSRVALLLFGLSVVLAMAAEAYAQSDGDSTEYIARSRGYPPAGVFRCDGQWGCHRKHRHQHDYVYRWGRPYAWRYYSVRGHREARERDEYRDRYEVDDARWHWRDRRDEVGERCKDEHVRVVGDTHMTTEGALKAAERHWQATVRYDFGERFMGLDNSRGYRFRCDRAETNESVAGKIAENLTGGEAFRKRCVVVARPCMQPLERGENIRK
jgi:hypothetical protein